MISLKRGYGGFLKGEALTGVGAGVGPGLGELLAVLPPHPIALNKAIMNAR